MKRGKLKNLILSCALCFSMIAPFFVQQTFAQTLGEQKVLDKNNKIATALDKNLETEVELSFPGKQGVLPADVVFVLDKSGASAANDIYKQAKQFLQEIKNEAKDKGLNVKVGVVLFNMHGNIKQELTDVISGYDDILKAMNSSVSMGTNMHAGLLAAQKLLDEDKTVKSSNKHIVLISDGATYLYSKDKNFKKAYTRSFGDPKKQTDPKTGQPYKNGSDKKGGIWEYQSREYNTPNDFKKFADGKNFVFSQATNDYKKLGEYLDYYKNQNKDTNKNWSQYEYEYNFSSAYLGFGRKTTPIDVNAPSNIDIAFLSADNVFQEMVNSGYDMNVYFKNAADFDGTEFLKYLVRKSNNGKLNTDFTKLKKEILNKISKESYIDDFIGKDFDFVNDIDKMKLQVGDEIISPEKIGDNKYGFGKLNDGSYRYVMTYTKGENEKIRLEVNETIYPNKPVSFKYKEKLVNIPTKIGVHKLKTNEGASLYPVDGNGKKGEKVDFPIPTVEYKVEGFNVSYLFVSETNGKELPEDVNKLLPLNETGKENGSEVIPTQPAKTTVKVEDGTWTFKGYDKEKIIINNADVKFVGKWEFTKNNIPTPNPGKLSIPWTLLVPAQPIKKVTQAKKGGKLAKTSIATTSMAGIILGLAGIVVSKRKK